MRIALMTCVAAACASALAWGAGQQSVAWDRAREFMGQYRTMIDSSGLVEVGANLPPHVRRDNLQSLCTARKEAIGRARQTANMGIRGLIPGDDPFTAERRAVFERYLGSVASFTGEERRGREALSGRA
jgi:hypothetical protein